eukprot:CAMPEP_0173434140 /NCGR_PEP_ID=MMETSP1357-20121228/12073_1 /TAXON_ID=77926 /ORGANISM="Hemiselmis rufescens, Strain PCC563" /LENGTH=56 /DNA_ID=CAMNT_0014398951 /DNA_START=26 /DNA_END=196 /DNA_ORIENTATION=-
MLFSVVPLESLVGPNRGPEWYNNPVAPNNCVGGSAQSCPLGSGQQAPPPAVWYPSQ